MSNPLLDKYFELYPEKTEKPKSIKEENAKIDFECEGKVTQVEKAFKKWASNTNSTLVTSSPNIPLTTSPTVVNPNSLIGPSPKSNVNANNFFLEIAEKIKNGTAQVTTASLQVDAVGTFSFGKTITFEVYDYEP